MMPRSARACQIAAIMIALPTLVAAAAVETPAGVWGGVYTDAQAARGQAQYGQHCAACHGDALGGADSAPALAGGGFLANWNGQSAGDLFTRIKTTMPFDAPGSLSSGTVADIEAYILSRNGFPAGPAELPHDAALLGRTKITTAKAGA